MKFEEVKARGSDNLEEVSFSMERTEEGGVLKAKLSDRILRNGKVRGEIYISTDEDNNKDCYFVVVKDLAANDISPRILSFGRKENVLSANAIVQIASRDQELPPDLIQCEYDGKKIPVEIRKLKKNIYRVQLSLDDAMATAIAEQKESGTEETVQPLEIVWSINNGKKVSKHKTPFVVDQSR